MKHLLLSIFISISALSVLGQNGISDNAEITRHLLEDETVTTAYLSKDIAKDAQNILYRRFTQTAKSLNLLTLPTPQNIKFMLIFNCKSEQSQRWAKELVRNLTKQLSDLQIIAKIKVDDTSTTIFGIPLDKENDTYSTTIYYSDGATSSSVVICGSDKNPSSIEKIVATYMSL